MASKLKYLVIHTTDSPYNREITADDIYMWHVGPKIESNRFLYMGKYYPLSELSKIKMTLPSGKIISIKNLVGRGWKKTGYSDLIQRSGKLINLNPYTYDDVIDSYEITNGAAGYNSVSRHVVLAGGWSKDGKIKNGINPETKKYFEPLELYTSNQIETLKRYIQIQLRFVPELIIVGHNQLSKKTCPNFDVKKFLIDNDLLNI